MRGFSITAILIALLIVHTDALGSDRGKVSIGILYPESYGDSHKLNQQAYQELTKCVEDVGFYVIYQQNVLEQQLKKINVEFPEHCRDPRCVIDIGSAAGMDRMLYGSIDFDDNRFGVQLTLIDVVMKQKIEAVSIEGARESVCLILLEQLLPGCMEIRGQILRKFQFTMVQGT